MNGKIKTKFAALFAVALMITVCVVPVVGNEGTDAAPVSSTNGEVFEGYDITLYKEGGDYSGLVYHGVFPSNFGLSEEDWTFAGSGIEGSEDNGYWVNEDTKRLMTVDDIPGYEVTPETYGMPMIQFVYDRIGADVNPITSNLTVYWNDGKSHKDVWVNKVNTASDATKIEGLLTITLTKDAENYADNEKLNLDEENWAGDFVVEVIAKQGVIQQVIKETVSAGPAVTVSGQITDADGKGIQGEYKIGDGEFVKTEKDGKFSSNVIPGSVVNIMVQAGNYTFKSGEETWNFGNVNAPVSKTFKAVEKTGTVTVQDKDGKPIANAELDLRWWTQVKQVTKNDNNTSTTKYLIQQMGDSAPTGVETLSDDYAKGTVSPLTGDDFVTGDDGKVSFAYTKPAGKVTAYNTDDEDVKYSDYAYALVAMGEDGDVYTFDTVTFDTSGEDLSLQSLISSKAGVADAQNGSATIKAKQSTGTITVQSANGNPVAGEEITLTWYTQVKQVTKNDNNTSTTKYLIQQMGDSAPTGVETLSDDYAKGTVSPLTGDDFVTGDDGKVSFAYTKPAGKVTAYNTDDEDVKYSDYAYALVAIGDNTGPYTFDTVSFSQSDYNSTLKSLIGSKAGMADAQGGSATIKAKQTSYKISGEVEGYSAKSDVSNIVSYKLGTSTDAVPVILQKDGSYTFYVIKDEILSSVKITTVDEVFNADLYTDDEVSIGTVYDNVEIDFKLKTESMGTGTVKYKVVAIPENTIVTFTYSIDGEKYTADVKSSASDIAELTITANMGAKIEVSATAENYQISALDGYKTTAIKMKTVYLKAMSNVVNGKPDTGTPIEGATFEFLCWDRDKIVSTQTLTTGKDGFVSVEFQDGLDYSIRKDNKLIDGDKTFFVSKANSEYVFGGYRVLDLTEFYPAAGNAYVKIAYMSAYNSDSVVSGPVLGVPIAGDAKTESIVVGESVALNAPSIDGFEFVAWMVDGVVVSESADYTLKVEKAGVTYDAVALYSAVHYEEPAEGLSMNVLVIGIVILILGILAVAYGIISKKQ